MNKLHLLFTFGKSFWKTTKNIENQGEKQVEALKDLKLKKQTKVIQGKSNNQSIATNIFNDLIKEKKSIMN